MTNAEAWFNIALRPRKPEGLLGRTAQDGHLDSHTAPELCGESSKRFRNMFYTDIGKENLHWSTGKEGVYGFIGLEGVSY